MTSRPQLSRRRLLRGAGVAMALPWLESLQPRAARGASAGNYPKRLAVLFMGNGINGNHWWAKQSVRGRPDAAGQEPAAPWSR